MAKKRFSHRIEVFPHRQGGFGFRRRAIRGGEITTPSQKYATRWNAKRAARSQFPGTPIVDVR